MKFTMKEYQSLSHTRCDCKSHVVFIPKRRKKRVFGVLRQHLGEMFHELASHKEAKIVEGHLMCGHVHICIPPKYAVSNVVGYIKGKSAIQIARKFGGRQKNFTDEHRGYVVSTVGLDANMVRTYIPNQEDEDERYDQMKLDMGKAALGGSRFYRRL